MEGARLSFPYMEKFGNSRSNEYYRRIPNDSVDIDMGNTIEMTTDQGRQH